VRIPTRHRSDKFVGVAIRIPGAGVGIMEEFAGFRVLVIKDSLHESSIEKKAFNLVALPETSFKSGFSIDVESITLNGHDRSRLLCNCRREAEKNNMEEEGGKSKAHDDFNVISVSGECYCFEG